MSDPSAPTESATTGSEKAPGWYHDDHGSVRWWNGTVWDVGAPGGGPDAGFGPGPDAGMPYGPPPGPEAYGGTVGYQPSGYPPPGYAPYGAGSYGGGPNASNGRTMALVSHLGAFVGGFVLPLVIMLTAGKDDPYVRHHSSEALNFQLTYGIFVLVGFFVSLLTLGFGLIVFIPLLLVAMVLHWVWAIMAAVAANRGEWYRYPVNLRMVKGAV